MPIQKTNLQELVEKATYLFRTRGYHHTSIHDIAEYCNVSKASVYHYMASKEALGSAVILHVHRDVRDHVFKYANTQGHTPKQNLHRFADALENFFMNKEGGCLIGNFALEVVGVVPVFEQLIKDYFTEWTSTLQHVLKSKYGEQEALILAEDSVAQTQGAILLQRLYNDSSFLTRSVEQLRELL